MLRTLVVGCSLRSYDANLSVRINPPPSRLPLCAAHSHPRHRCSNDHISGAPRAKPTMQICPAGAGILMLSQWAQSVWSIRRWKIFGCEEAEQMGGRDARAASTRFVGRQDANRDTRAGRKERHQNASLQCDKSRKDRHTSSAAEETPRGTTGRHAERGRMVWVKNSQWPKHNGACEHVCLQPAMLLPRISPHWVEGSPMQKNEEEEGDGQQRGV